ncbi:MAG: hypothetical protein AAF902_15575 [Chloroflexota bacterium]
MNQFTAQRPQVLFVFSILFLGLMAISTVQFDHVSAQANVTDRTIYCNPSGGSGGLAPGTYSDTTLFGQPVIIIVSENYDPSTPTLLTFYLHGDGGGYDFYSQDGRPLNQVVRDNGWIYVAPQSYLDTESGRNRWWAAGISGSEAGNAGIEANAQLLEDIFEEMFAKYNICQDILLGHSASGGSWFYDAYFVPTRGDEYPAFMNLGCGSSGISSSWTGFPFYSNLNTFKDNAAIQNRTQLHYTIGDQDFLFAGAERAVPHYRDLGFDVTTDFLADVEHCAFDLSAKTVDYWMAVNNSVTVSDAPIGEPTSTPTATATVTPTPTMTPTPFPEGFLDEFIYLPMVLNEQ